MRSILVIAASCAVALAQTPAQAPEKIEFEVASVKPSPPLVPGQISVGVHIDGAQVHCTYLSIQDYIRAAFQVKAYQIEAPDFTASDRFDISAKLPHAASRDDVNKMLQTLLVDRFGLKFHRDRKEFPVYALTAAKGGIKAKESPIDPDKSTVNVTSTAVGTGAVVDLGKGASFTIGDHTFEAHKLTMDRLAEMLARFLDLPVVDMTETTAAYDFTLEIKPEEFLAMKIRSAVVAGVTLPPEALKLLDNARDDSLIAALAQQGLRLERRKAPLDIIVVDHVEKTPIEN
jgi:uncharacterized protein (TIGR03435 family)